MESERFLQNDDIAPYSFARNFISAGSLRHRFFRRCGLSFASSLRKRSGVRDKYRSADPRPTWPI